MGFIRENADLKVSGNSFKVWTELGADRVRARLGLRDRVEG